MTMTAAHALTVPASTGPKHAAPKPSRRPHMPHLSMPSIPTPSLPKRAPKAAKAPKPHGTARKLTATGEAMFSVAGNGDVTRNIAQVGAGHFSTFAQDAAKGLPRVNDSWIVQLFETEAERKNRQKAELVVAGLGAAARLAAKLAR